MKVQKLLNRYWSAKIDSVEKLFQVQIDSFKEAVRLARETMELRLAGMNEFRDTLRDQASRFALEKDVRELKDWIRSELKPLQNQQILLSEKAERKSVNIALIISVIGIIIGIISIIVHWIR